MRAPQPEPSSLFSRRWLIVGLAAVWLLLLLLGWMLLRGHAASQARPTWPYDAGPSPTVDVSAFLTALPDIPVENATPVPWDGESPFYILLLGVDDRPWVNNWGPPRSDTLVVLAYHPAEQRVGVLSLPRDLMVSVPEWPAYPQKLNMAFAAGFAQGGPHAGARYALRVVNDLLDMDIQHYAVVNYAAFVTIIDALGGVVVDVPKTLVIGVHDPQTGEYRPVRLKPGRQTLSGDMALGYVRFRSDAEGDFGRMARQQQVLWAVYQRLQQPRTWQRLLPQVPRLYEQVRNGLWTNLSLSDAITLAWQIRQVPYTHIRFAVVTQQQAPATLINGVYVLQPDRAALRALRDEVLLSTSTEPASPEPTMTFTPVPLPTLRPSPTPTPNLWPAAREEMARIALYNAAGEPGLACRTAVFLQRYGFWVVHTGNAPEYAKYSYIVNTANKPATLALLQQMLNIEDRQVVHRAELPDDAVNAEIAIYLGQDWAENNPLPAYGDQCP